MGLLGAGHYQLYLHISGPPQVHNFQLNVPSLEVECPSEVTVGKVVRVKLRFHNVLQCSLSHIIFLAQGQALLSQRELTHK